MKRDLIFRIWTFCSILTDPFMFFLVANFLKSESSIASLSTISKSGAINLIE